MWGGFSFTSTFLHCNCTSAHFSCAHILSSDNWCSSCSCVSVQELHCLKDRLPGPVKAGVSSCITGRCSLELWSTTRSTAQVANTGQRYIYCINKWNVFILKNDSSETYISNTELQYLYFRSFDIFFISKANISYSTYTDESSMKETNVVPLLYWCLNLKA